MRRNLLLLPSFCLLVPVTGAQWSAPTPVANLNSTGSDFDPSPTMLGLTIFFSSNRTGNFEIFSATRTAPYTAFGVPTQLMELSSTATDAGPFARIDEREIFFYSARAGGGGGGLDLWRADRSSASGPFNPPVPVLELNSSGSDATPSLTTDGLRIYFATTRGGGLGGYDIWTATRPNWSTPFSAPTPVVELNSTVTDYDCHIGPDGLTIFFGSNRPGSQGLDDVWMASRLDPNSPFGTPVNVSALNSTATETAPGFSLFADEIFFTSTRPGGLGSYDIHTARFTGVTSLGMASPGSIQELRFSDPSSPMLPYLAAASLGSSPGIRIDTRVLPLNFDLLLQLSLGGLPPILTGFVGLLDQDGVAAGKISFAGFPQFVGLQFFNAFVVIDPAAPSSIRTISNAHEVKVQ